jgi:hypothetical protein
MMEATVVVDGGVFYSCWVEEEQAIAKMKYKPSGVSKIIIIDAT